MLKKYTYDHCAHFCLRFFFLDLITLMMKMRTQMNIIVIEKDVICPGTKMITKGIYEEMNELDPLAQKILQKVETMRGWHKDLLNDSLIIINNHVSFFFNLLAFLI